MQPIAIIGMGCRFPGAKDPEIFWQLLRDGRSAIIETPRQRWEAAAFYDPDISKPGKINTRWGGFLDQIDQFDANFFRIAPKEVIRMDPQQRLLLEVAWEALENAGQVVEDLAGSDTGVFIGIAINDYGRMQWNRPNTINAYVNVGNAFSIAAGRISYIFDFKGPSIAIDTACSSSLVAIHLACQSLSNGEASLALAGGVNLIISPELTIGFSKAAMLSPDGCCKAFDAQANGYVRGEGAGIVVLKPLSKALADNDSIYALIKSSVVNQDGRTNGLTAPNRQSQEALLREAYQRAGISPAQVQYVETHGTGTILGDPIEARALGTVLGRDRPANTYCAIGSVKTNIGHLETAAGIAGLIKVALALKHREIPPSLHFSQANPYIPFDELRLQVQQELAPWPIEDTGAIAGVSSFGFAGTNAHVVLQGYYQDALSQNNNEQWREGYPFILTLSAHNPEALHCLVDVYQDRLSSGSFTNLSLQDICYSVSNRRDHHDYRLALTASSLNELREELRLFLQGESHSNISYGRRSPNQRPKLVCHFPGQGSQWWAMGRGLLKEEPLFYNTIKQCDELLSKYVNWVNWSLLAELMSEQSSSRLDKTEIAQLAIFAIQIALAKLWASWGIVPDIVIGHSLGEVAAAHIAGILSLADAIRIVVYRGRIMEQMAGQGRMVAVDLPQQEIEQILIGYKDKLAIAAYNSPTQSVLSGDSYFLNEI
ncbi:MAG: type I polyketide synthase, partial [Acidobacteriota bacterium]